MKNLSLPLVALAILSWLPVSAQINSLVIGEKQSFTSAVLGEPRDILVSAPAKISQALPLIIVFDGEGLFEPVVSAVRYMNSYSELPQIPQAVILGIINTDRNRDMPVPQQYGNGQNGKNNFLKFIQDELIPWAAKKYNLNGHNIIIGHSQGAYFANYMMTQKPTVFPWILSIDAPMLVDEQNISFLKDVSKTVSDQKNKIRYISVESLFGWEDQWNSSMMDADRAKQIRTSGETHESVAYKAIYDGLHFLFKDFQPARKDMKLSELKSHYEEISDKYGFKYDIPLRVLMASAARKQNESRKQEVLDLADYAEKKYGSSITIDNFRNAASMMAEDGAAILDYYLNLPRPSLETVQPFLGLWEGVVGRKQTPPEGVHVPVQSTKFTVEIAIVSGKPVLQYVNPPWAPGKKTEMEIFHITKDGELIFGYRNRGAGLIISRARLNKKGNLEGSETLVGARIPPDIPDDVRKIVEFMNNNPATFEFVRTPNPLKGAKSP